MRRRNRDALGMVGNFTEIPAEDFRVRVFARYCAAVLLDWHRFTDDFISFVCSLLPEKRLLEQARDIAGIAASVLDADDDMAADFRSTVLSGSSASLPAECDLQEFYKAVWNSVHREALIARIKEDLVAGLADDGISFACDADSPERRSQLLSLSETDVLVRLRRVFPLSDEAVLLISLYHTASTFLTFCNLFEEWTQNEIILACRRIFGGAAELWMSLFSNSGPLLKNGLMEEENRRRGTGYCLSDTLLTYLSLPGRNDLAETMCELDQDETYALETFHVDRIREDTSIDLLRSGQPVNLLLYGKEGTGKTEYARALAKAAGKRLYIYRQEESEGRRYDDLFKLTLISRSSLAEDTILLIDEADTILGTAPGGFFALFGGGATGSKSRINQLLDGTRCSIIWITNRTRQLDASTRRRFTYSIEFAALSPMAIRELTAAKLAPLGLAPEDAAEIAAIAGRSGLNAASVSFLAQNLASLPPETLTGGTAGREHLLRRVRSLFNANTRLITGTLPFRVETGKTYSVDALNTSVNARSIVSAIQAFYRASDEGMDYASGLRVLLYGESGTGKTEFARFIAESLGRPLLIKRASDILSPWVGMSEQQVAEVFREAEETRSILLLDEADSFFASRDNAVRSWERTLVNEFLTRMEEFSGVLLCATNARGTMDKAVMRRFHQSVEFYPLSAEGITELLARYFPAVSFTDSQILDLFMNGSLTPGDFAALQGRLCFESSEPDPQYIAGALSDLSRARQAG